MKTIKGTDQYPVPDDLYRVTDVTVEMNGGIYCRIMLIPPSQMREMREKGEYGVPSYASMAVNGPGLWVYPVPDAPYNVLVRYEPYPKQF